MLSNILDKSEQCRHNQSKTVTLGSLQNCYTWSLQAQQPLQSIYSRGRDIYENERFVARGQGDRNGKYPELFLTPECMYSNGCKDIFHEWRPGQRFILRR